MTVAVVTDSASDLPPDAAQAARIAVVPLNVHFAAQGFRAGLDLSSADFWDRMLEPDAPFPTTSAASPAAFQEAFEKAFAGVAEAIVCVDVSETLSGTIKSARVAAGLMPDREIHVVDSRSASMGTGLLALLAADLAREGKPAAQIVDELGRRLPDVDLFVAVDTLEYLRRGGRISGARAAIGTLLSVKPIITIRDGLVDVADRPRTRSRARERVIELLTARRVERLAILYAPPADPAAFRDEVVARLPGGIDPAGVSVELIGPSVGPHLGPGCIGGVVLIAAA
jgi:DegV family protein with EDD domain